MSERYQIRLIIKDVPGKRIQLKDIATICEAWNSILHITFDGLMQVNPADQDNRPCLTIESTHVENGSIEVFSDLIVTQPQLILPTLGLFNADQVFKSAKGLLDLWKALSAASKAGKTVNVEHNSGVVIPIILNNVTIGGDLNLSIDEALLSSAIKVQNPAEALLKPVIAGRVLQTEIQSVSEPEESASLTIDNAEDFDLPSTIEDSPLTFRANVISFNKESKKGRLEIAQSWPGQKKYSFEATSDELAGRCIEAMKEKAVTITALREVVSFAGHDSRVRQFRVIGISQGKKL